jgi:Na+-translocating ferredoxin:NAD+ oxidoreductase RnfG subunit
VEVNVTGNLIALATKFLEKDQPDVAQVLKGLQSVHVNVIALNDDNRSDVQTRVEGVRKDLEAKGWDRIVKVQDNGQDVGVYLKTQNKDTVQGLAVIVIDADKQAVFVNVVGDIKPEQLSMLGEKLHIDPLKEIGHEVEKTKPSAERP